MQGMCGPMFFQGCVGPCNGLKRYLFKDVCGAIERLKGVIQEMAEGAYKAAQGVIQRYVVVQLRA